METTYVYPSCPVPSRVATRDPARPMHRFALAAGHAKSLPARAGGTVVRCESGRVWLTQAGDDRDIVLSRGDRFACEHGRHVVVEALDDAVVGVLCE